MILLVLVKKRKGRGKWHVDHQWACCLEMSDLCAPHPNQSRVDVLLSPEDPAELRLAGNQNNYVDAVDVCATCLNNLLRRVKKHGLERMPER